MNLKENSRAIYKKHFQVKIKLKRDGRLKKIYSKRIEGVREKVMFRIKETMRAVYPA